MKENMHRQYQEIINQLVGVIMCQSNNAQIMLEASRDIVKLVAGKENPDSAEILSIIINAQLQMEPTSKATRGMLENVKAKINELP